MLPEKLIDKVRKYSFLYDNSEADYKNILKKAKTWMQIAAELNQDAETVKTKWKNLRDAYLKHKQGVNRYKSWPWSEQMKFLDCTLEPRPCKSNIPSSSDIVTGGNDCHSEEFADSIVFSQEVFAKREDESQSQDDCVSESMLLPSTSQINPPPKKMKTEPNENVQSVISYLEKKQQYKDRHEEVDYLFLSYAKTFKRFSVRSQAKLKVQLAQLFAETELAELEEQHPARFSPSLSVDSARTDFSEHTTDATTRPAEDVTITPIPTEEVPSYKKRRR